MLHLKRLLWLAAWSVWLWLGFGLARELPRQYGPPLCNLHLPKGAIKAGFVGATDRYLVVFPGNRSGVTSVRALNAESGTVAAEAEGPNINALLLQRLDPVRGELLFANELPYFGGRFFRKGMFVFDASKMEWRRAGDALASKAVHHPSRPWLMFVQRPEPLSNKSRIVVFDHMAGREIFGRDLQDGFARPGPFFGEDGRVVIPIQLFSQDPQAAERRTMEVWNVSDSPRLESSTADVPFGVYGGGSSNGRSLTMDERLVVRVYDAAKSQVVFTREERESSTSARRRMSGAKSPIDGVTALVMSASGRCALVASPTSLWNVESGCAVWFPGLHERASPADSEEQFVVVEKWSELWSAWLPNKFNFVTYAFRSLEDGCLVYRTSDRVPLRPSNWNSNGTLGVADDGNVYRLPLSVHYPLLALCQTILALPLVLLWAALRWRARRAARRQPAVLFESQ